MSVQHVVDVADCSEAEYKCSNSVTCIEKKSQCDQVANCELADDEDLLTCAGKLQF